MQSKNILLCILLKALIYLLNENRNELIVNFEPLEIAIYPFGKIFGLTEQFGNSLRLKKKWDDYANKNFYEDYLDRFLSSLSLLLLVFD